MGSSIIDINTIGSFGRVFELILTEDDLVTGVHDFRLIGTTKMSGLVRMIDNRYSLTAQLAGQQSVDCTRCLVPVARNLQLEIKAEFVDVGRFVGEQAVELSLEDLDADELVGDVIDLSQLAQEQIALNIPAQLLCREDCKGLCEKCGQNLNLLDCNCGRDDVDPRWAALKRIKE